MNQPLKILRLPSLALDVVFDQMALEEIFKLSKCSAKTQALMKQFTRRRSYDASVKLDYSSSYTISAKYGWEGREINSKMFDCIGFNFQVSQKALMQEIFKMLDLFRPTTSLDIQCGNWGVEAWVSTCSMLNLKLAKVVVRTLMGHVNIKQYKCALRTFKDASSLTFLVTPPEDIRLEDKDVPRFTCDSITMASANWITINQFFNFFINCRTVLLYSCMFRSNDLYQIIEKWLNREVRLEKVDLFLDVFFSIVPPIEDIVKDTPYRSEENVKFRNCYKTYPVGYVIQRSDGVEAAICCDRGLFALGTHFETNMDPPNRALR